MFLNIFKHLLPRAKSFRITQNKQLRQFFEGLEFLGDDVKDYYDNIYEQYFALTTDEIEAWEFQLGIPFSDNLTTLQRQQRILGAKQNQGGQDPRYIQDALQALGFDVYVHEWWEPGDRLPVNTPGCVTPRNPLLYLGDGDSIVLTQCADEDSQAGQLTAQCGFSNDPKGYALVNKIDTLSLVLVPVIGSPDVQVGGGGVQIGQKTFASTPINYPIPNDPTKWPYFLYIGGEEFPEMGTVLFQRREEFENLLLKICPTQNWIGVLVNYT